MEPCVGWGAKVHPSARHISGLQWIQRALPSEPWQPGPPLPSKQKPERSCTSALAGRPQLSPFFDATPNPPCGSGWRPQSNISREAACHQGLRPLRAETCLCSKTVLGAESENTQRQPMIRRGTRNQPPSYSTEYKGIPSARPIRRLPSHSAPRLVAGHRMATKTSRLSC